MKAVIAIDSFKGSLSSMEAGEAAAEGIRRVFPEACLVVRPLADGGEGTVEALTAGMGGRLRKIRVTGPLGEPVECSYGILEHRQSEDAMQPEKEPQPEKTAVLEMAGAAGITLVPEKKRNPLYTTTYGVGEAIRDAIENGCRKFLIGIGGSATNDGGIGMLQALGYGFMTGTGKQVPFGAEGLRQLAWIECGHAMPELAECEFHVACDVENVLCGSQGCSAVFGPQKGARPEMIRGMDNWMARYAAMVSETLTTKVDPNYPGSGAAGGLGFALRSFLHAELEPGVRIVLRETGLEAEIRDADVVVTGEGRLDGQTVMGKAPVGVAELAKRYGKPVLAFAGCVEPEAAACNEHGIDAFFPILRNVVTREEAMQKASAGRNLADAVEQVFRVLHLWKN